MSREGTTGWTRQSISPGSCQGNGSKAAHPSLECWVGRLGDTGLSWAAGTSELRPCQRCPGWAGPAKDGISSASKHPWLQAQKTRLSRAAAGVQLSQRLNKPKQGTK